MINKSLEITQTQFGNFVIDEFDLIGNFIKNMGYWEYHLYQIYSKLIDDESYCIDAGANIGFHTIQFGFLGKKVYSFEPQSYVYNQLCTNILFNGLDNKIESYRLGLGDKQEKQQLWNIEHENWVGNGAHNWGGRGVIQDNLDVDRATKNEYREEDIINIITLDSLNIPKCDLMKIDIQGYEYNMLKGGEILIKNNKPVIFIENYDGLCGDNIKAQERERAPIDLLLSWGYKGYRLLMGNNDDCIFTYSTDMESLLQSLNFEYEKIK
jgi:FkbM family methyltransferase